MPHTLRRAAFSAAILLTATPTIAAAGDIAPWTPAPGGGRVEFAYVRQKADKLFVGDAKMPLPGDLTQDAGTLSISYGVTERFAIDVEAGYAESHFLVVPGLAPNGGLDGLTDVVVGLRYKLTDEADGAPATLTAGVAGIIDGGYRTGALPAIGDGANGVQLAVAAGRQFGPVSVSADLGYRFRAKAVPNESFGSIQASATVTSRISVYGGIAFVDSNGDLDIGAPGFTPARFPETEEDYKLWTVGAAFGVTDRASLSVTYGHVFDGRNTANSSVWRVGVGYAF